MKLSRLQWGSYQLTYSTMTRQITDDPSAKHVDVRRGRKRVVQKTQHSKSSISVMLAGSAAG